MKNNYDVLIIGAGISGICAAYELSIKRKDLKIGILEQGNGIYERSCPIISKKVTKCAHCQECSIMKGFGGAGSFSDGKFNITTEFGGWLNSYVSDEEVMNLIHYVDGINIEFGAPQETLYKNSEKTQAIEREALKHDLHLLNADVKHFGTERNLEILKNYYQFLSSRVDIQCNCKVEDIEISEEGYLVVLENGINYTTTYLIMAPGRSGAEWFGNLCKKHGFALTNNQVDIGVRVEVPAIILEEITSNLYEAKLKYRTKCYGDIVRTFCMNPYGYVVTENIDGIITVNGHSYGDQKLRSKNTNFALLVSGTFTEPFNDPYQYGKRIASCSNLLGDGVIIQRFGDLISGRRTTASRLEKSFVHPTLAAAEPGDLSLVIPKRQLDSIIEMLYVLDELAPGIANEDTLLYGVEVKFYSSKPRLSKCLEMESKNLFAIGDGAGVTRGISQAAASGILVAREILKREGE